MALAKTEAWRMRWFETHQQDIRADLYQNLADALHAHDHTTGEQVRPPPETCLRELVLLLNDAECIAASH